jgi:hypothetical protein
METALNGDEITSPPGRIFEKYVSTSNWNLPLNGRSRKSGWM